MKLTEDYIKSEMINCDGLSQDKVDRIYTTIGLVGKLIIEQVKGETFTKMEEFEVGAYLLVASVDESIKYISLAEDKLQKLYSKLMGKAVDPSSVVLAIDASTGELLVQTYMDYEEFNKSCLELRKFPLGAIDEMEVLFHGNEYVVFIGGEPAYSNSVDISVTKEPDFGVKYKYKDGASLKCLC